MKNLFMFIVISSMVWSCTQDEVSDSPTTIDSDENIELKNSLDTLDALTLEQVDSIFNEEFKDYVKIKPLSKLEIDAFKNKSILKDGNTKRAPVLNGPFTLDAVQTLVTANKAIVFGGGQGGLSVGTYICDIYKFQSTVNLPINSAPYIIQPTPVGYISASSQTLGVSELTNTTSTNKQYVLATWMIKVKYNIIGQTINVNLPNILQNGFDYTYYYFTF